MIMGLQNIGINENNLISTEVDCENVYVLDTTFQSLCPFPKH